ncbi:MAG: Abi-alpha family protein [Sciscionella sp.]
MTEFGGRGRRDPEGAAVLLDSAAVLIGRCARAGWRLARRLPGGSTMQNGVRELQDAVLTEVAQRLDAARYVEGAGGPAEDDLASTTREVNRALHGVRDSVLTIGKQHREVLDQRTRFDNGDAGGPGSVPAAVMASLLNRSVEPDRVSAEHYLVCAVLACLTPDEARILAAMSEGAVFPLMHVHSRSALGTTRAVLRNASTVGTSAGVVLADQVPLYLSRLLGLGLLSTGPADHQMDTDYDILATQSLVQRAEGQAREQGNLAPKLIRRTIGLSEFGTLFWRRCDPSVPIPDGAQPRTEPRTPRQEFGRSPEPATRHRSIAIVTDERG